MEPDCVVAAREMLTGPQYPVEPTIPWIVATVCGVSVTTSAATGSAPGRKARQRMTRGITRKKKKKKKKKKIKLYNKPLNNQNFFFPHQTHHTRPEAHTRGGASQA